MTGPQQTILFKRQGSRWAVNFQYNAKLVEWCKTVPSYGRSYDPPTRTWLFERQFGEQLATEWRNAGYKIVGMEAGQERARRAPPPPPPRALPARESWAVALLDRADELDPALSERLRKQLARVLHPDAGGSAEMMQELNDAATARRNGNARPPE